LNYDTLIDLCCQKAKKKHSFWASNQKNTVSEHQTHIYLYVDEINFYKYIYTPYVEFSFFNQS